ncbi:uncharacterized protein LOC144706822 [Wolffia australiana]
MNNRNFAAALAILIVLILTSDPPIAAGLRVLQAEPDLVLVPKSSPVPKQGDPPSPSRPSIPLPTPVAASNSTTPPGNITIPAPIQSPPLIPSPPQPTSSSPPLIPSPPQSTSSSPPLNHSNGTPPSPLPPTKRNNTESMNTSSPPENSSECASSSPFPCSIAGLVACLRKESQGWYLVLQNKGIVPLNLTVKAPPSVISEQVIRVTKQSTSKIKVNMGSDDNVSIDLKAGDQTCTVSVAPPPSTPKRVDVFSYDVGHVTPLHGVYMASFSIILIGGVWACCKLKKRRGGGAEAVYQQLEMGSQLPPATSINDHRVDGWDEHWSEGWDEEEAQPRAPEGRTAAAARSSTDKNDWEDWDD